MADIQNIEIGVDYILVSLMMSKTEYELLGKATTDLALLPTDEDLLSMRLTTGKLGNGNRIMVPNKMLASYDIKKLIKKVPAGVFDIDGRKLLLIQLAGRRKGVPEFGDEEQ